jgi:hypothetical protein
LEKEISKVSEIEKIVKELKEKAMDKLATLYFLFCR